MCMVQTAHSVTWPPNRPATEYSTYAWPSLIICTRSLTPATILVAVCHVAHVTYTSRDKKTQFSTWTKIKKVIATEMSRIRIQTSACQLLITYQTKVPATWFLTNPRHPWEHVVVLDLKPAPPRSLSPWCTLSLYLHWRLWMICSAGLGLELFNLWINACECLSLICEWCSIGLGLGLELAYMLYVSMLGLELVYMLYD
jgi:hypothetical protein